MSGSRDSGEFASPLPRRWLDDDDAATDAERALLRTAAHVDPPAGADRKVWMAIAAKIGPIAGGPGGSGGGAPGAGPATASAAAKGAAAAATSAASAGGGIVTSALIGAGCAVALLVGSAAIDTKRPNPPVKPDVLAIAPAPTPKPAALHGDAIAAPTAVASVAVPVDVRAESSAAPSTAKSTDVAPARSAEAPTLDPGAADAGEVAAPLDPSGSGANVDPGSPVGAGDAASLLREESQLLSQAREALHGGDVHRCFHLLDTARKRFPSGGLGQEREALTIEALAQSGNRVLAVEHANAFLRAYPTSPHAARVRTFAQ